MTESPLRCPRLFSRGQLLLAKTIIRLHEKRGIPIKDFVRGLITAVAYWHHDLVELLLDLKDRRPSLCDSTSPAELGPASPSILNMPKTVRQDRHRSPVEEDLGPDY